MNTTNADALKALAAMDASLLTVKDLGAGFTKLAATPDNPSDKLPCGGTSAVALYPNALHAEFDAAKGQSVQFQESLRLYLDAATASKAFLVTAAGLNCTKGTIGGTPVTIDKPKDITAEVGGDRAVGWQVSIDGATGVLIAVTSGSVTIGYTFIAATGTDTATLPNPVQLAKKATAKILAGGLG